MYSVLIGICCGGNIRGETVSDLIAAINTLVSKNVGYMTSIQIGGYKDHNCNHLVEEAKKNNASHLMFIDSDMRFPSSGILRLLDSDKDIIGGNYHVRGNPSVGDPREYVIKLLDEETGKPVDHVIDIRETPQTIFKVRSLGLGFSLVKMSVFDKLSKPYFQDHEASDGEHFTEDVVFFDECRKAGFDVYCNPTIEIGHIGAYTY